MSQQELACASGFSRSAILRLEKGKIPLTLDSCNRIAKAISIEPSDLFDDYLSFIAGNYEEKIKKNRMVLGLSQKEFACLLNVNTRTVRQWEKGRTTPLRENVKRIFEIIKRQTGYTVK